MCCLRRQRAAPHPHPHGCPFAALLRPAAAHLVSPTPTPQPAGCPLLAYTTRTDDKLTVAKYLRADPRPRWAALGTAPALVQTVTVVPALEVSRATPAAGASLHVLRWLRWAWLDSDVGQGWSQNPFAALRW